MNNSLPIIILVLVVGAIGYFTLQPNKPLPNTTVPATKQENINNSKTDMSQNTIVDTAIANDNFKTLVAAIQAAGLVDTLSGSGPFTVFAPTDEAFAKLPAGTVESLLKDKEKLAAILTYHVVPGKVMAADVVKLTTAKTVNGQDLTIKVDGNKVMVNDALVTATDVLASNGVIHIIDTVLLPR